MAITFGGDSISTDSTTLEKNVNRTINATGVASGGQTIESFNSTGLATAQYRPQCMKHGTMPQSHIGNWTYTTTSNWGADGVRDNIGGDALDEATGTFTAPVSGVYQFATHGIPVGSTADSRCAIYKNGSYAARWIVTSQNGSHGAQTGGPIALYLAAGDYINAGMYSGVGQHTGTWAGFSGVLIG